MRFALERTGDSLLGVEINTGMDAFEVVATNELEQYAGLELANGGGKVMEEPHRYQLPNPAQHNCSLIA